MRSLFLVCVLSLLLGSAASAAGLTQVADQELVHILNHSVVVAEQKALPVAVRILRVRDHGECDGKPETCPKEVLYIAVSTFDEAPDEKVYVLPKSYGWDFITWKTIPKEEGASHHVVLEVREKIVSSKPEKSWWSEQRYEIGANPWSGYMNAVRHNP
jgi:hypothetical protein